MDTNSTQSIVIPKGLAGVRFDQALAQLLPERSKSQLQKLVRKGSIKLNGRKILRSNFKLQGGERLTYCLDGGLPTERIALELSYLHVDEEFAVVNKPAGMITHPVDRHTGGSVAENLVERFGPLPSRDDAYRPGIVHRLDRETSGVMVVALTEHALEHLQDQFRNRTVRKRYLALVHGAPELDKFSVEAPLGTVPGQRDLQGIMQGGREAFTDFVVQRKWKEFSLVECHPTTGRRHQLRVHLWTEGFPIAGDKLYRPKDKSDRAKALRHHALHCDSLGFRHPVTEEELTFEAPLPEEFDSFIRSL
ncbi:MAG: 23S rRNA pseudouridine1911/1915/1917 synthase [Planctomycetota bacterium]|jgi:23S rRNA pseudouridine1911/1915/1917 synthase